MLFFVGTPIGNLKDISERALDTLRSSDVIACEDTRVTIKLLSFYGIEKKLISYNKNNEKESAEGILSILKDGKTVSVVSDSGMPLISDPGNFLSKFLWEKNVEYSVIPGPSACLSALVLSGLDTSRFAFVGFLPDDKKERDELLESVKDVQMTLVFHISPHNIRKDFEQLFLHLGERQACVVKEITKMFETSKRFTLGEDVEIDERGEFVLVVEGAKKKENELLKLSPLEQIEFYVAGGMSKNDAIKRVARERNTNKNEIYKLTLN